MERKFNGIPILNDDIRVEYKDKYYIKKFNIDGDMYYFKPFTRDGVPYSELIANEFARDYGIPCIEYYYAKYNGSCGFLSKDFSSDDQKHMSRYLYETPAGYIVNSIGNISDSFEDMPSHDRIIEELYNLIVFDIIIGNADRHEDNIIVTRDETIYPIFDNDWTGSNVAVKENHYSLFIDYYAESVFRELYEHNREYYYKLVYSLRLLNYKHLKDIIDRVEEKIGTSIRQSDKDEIIDTFTYNRQNIERHLSKIK